MDNRDNIIYEGRLEKLEAQVERYLTEQGDRILTEYLVQLKNRIRNQKVQVDLLQEELERSYQMYLRRVQIAEEAQKTEMQEKQPQEEVRLAVQQTEQLQNQKLMAEQQEKVAENPVQQIEQLQEEGENPQYFAYREVQPVQSPKKKFSGGAEYMIGTAILSIVGGVFILTALVMLGMYFMNGFIKGMCIYGGALLMLFISELLIQRKWPKLATVFSAIGIGGLYLATVINYLALHNFGMPLAVAIILLVTVFVIVLSRKRDSFVYRVLALCAGYLCAMAVGENLTVVEFGVLIGIIFLINVLCLIIPAGKYRTAFHAIHLCCNLLFAYGVDFRLDDVALPLAYRLVTAIGLLAVMQLILIMQLQYERKASEAGTQVGGIAVKICYWISVIGFSDVLSWIFWENTDVTFMHRYGSVAAVVIICTVAIVLLRKNPVKWYPYYLLNLICWAICSHTENELEFLICLLVLLAVAKLLSLWRIPALRLSDAVITTIICIGLLANTDETGVGVYLLLAGVVISVFFISQWQTYFEIVLTYSLAFFTAGQMGPMLKLPIFTGLLFVGILLYNNVERFRGKNIIVYNGAALSGELICCLLLLNPVYQNAFLTYLCMLVFGLATIVLTFQEKYRMDFKQKNLIMAIFLTYMALVMRVGLPIVNSILLMVIALICVGTGFVVKEKAIRIYGLVLSLIVCGKIVLYDYVAALILQKTILFFVVGVIALIIAGIYIILEKKNNSD